MLLCLTQLPTSPYLLTGQPTSVSQPARYIVVCQSLSDSFVFLDIWDDLWGADFLLGTLCDKSQLFIPTWRWGRLFPYESYRKICLVSAVCQNLGFSYLQPLYDCMLALLVYGFKLLMPRTYSRSDRSLSVIKCGHWP